MPPVVAATLKTDVTRRACPAPSFFSIQGWFMAASADVSLLARRFAPWSFSKMEAAEACPAQFNFKHVAKTAASPATSDTKVGIHVHEVLEHRVLGKSARDAQQLAAAKTPLTTQEQETLHMFAENIEDFLQRFDRFCKTQGVTKLLTEVAWGFTDTYQPASFFAPDVYFRGKLDLGILTRDNDLYLLDHKSGVAKPLVDDPKKQAQLQAYGVLAMPNLPDIGGVRGGIHFLQGDAPLRIQWAPYLAANTLRAAYRPWLFDRINEAAANLTEPYEARPAKSRMKKNKQPGWPCGWCNYQAHCPAFKEKFGGA